VLEASDGRARNGDGDATDLVVSLRNRVTGAGDPLGAPAGCGIPASPPPEGRAIVQVNDPPFTFPAIAAERDVVAFLENESATNNPAPPGSSCDVSGNHRRNDGILRVFRLGGGELTGSVSPPRAVDAAPLVNGRPLAISDGLVFFRTREAALATNTLVQASVKTGGGQANTTNGGGTFVSAISNDGRFVAFSDRRSDLEAPDGNLVNDIFLRNRPAGTTTRISEGPGGAQLVFGSEWPHISGNGRYIVYHTISNPAGSPADPSSWEDIFLFDRIAGTTQFISVGTGGAPGQGPSTFATVSDDGRFVAFSSLANDLVVGDTSDPANDGHDVFVRDRCVANGTPVSGCMLRTVLVTKASDGTQGDGGPRDLNVRAMISGNGRFVAFDASFTNLVPNDTNNASDVFVHDLVTGQTERVSVASDGSQSLLGSAGDPHISTDGRFVTFGSSAADLVGGDTNGVTDAFIHDRLTGITERVSVATSGLQGTGGGSGGRAPVTDDGRFVLLGSSATDLVPDDTNGAGDVFLHDRLTGVTERVSVRLDGTQASGLRGDMSADGHFISVESTVALVGADTNGLSDVYVLGIDESDPLGIDTALFRDLRLDDTVLEVLDTTGAPAALATLCPAEQTAVAAGNAAFLRPEAAAESIIVPGCPKGSLNGDGDVTDLVVQLSLGGGPTQNLGRAGTFVAISDALLAALVSESANGNANYNGDSDMNDSVVQVHPVGAGAWNNIGQAADALAVSGQVAAFITPEAAQGAILNGDGDTSDRVLQVWDDGVPELRNVGQAAEEFVLANREATNCGVRQLVAFRTSEAAQASGPPPGCSLNGDDDCDDDVMQVYDVVSRTLYPTGQAVLPLEVCNPERPYEVTGSRVRFLTSEVDQDEDLDGDGAVGSVVVQVFDVCTQIVTTQGTVDENAADPLTETDGGQLLQTLAGRCAAQPAIACDPLTSSDTCPRGSFCNVSTSRCTLTFPGVCRENPDCPPGSVCVAETVIVVASPSDRDGDGIPDSEDLCPDHQDPAQVDSDGDGVGNACDAAPFPGCPPVPQPGCRRPVDDGRAVLVVKNNLDNDKRDAIVWRWIRGAQTAFADFGDPLTDETYTMCLYDESGGTPELSARVSAPAGGVCNARGNPCWKVAGRDGGNRYVYADREKTPNGMVRLMLKSGDAGRARIVARAKGPVLQLPPLPLALPTRVQLHSSSGACWEAGYAAGDNVIRSDDTMFKAKAVTLGTVQTTTSSTTTTSTTTTTTTTIALPSCPTPFAPCGSCGGGICAITVDSGQVCVGSAGSGAACAATSQCPGGEVCVITSPTTAACLAVCP
jgi:Tol biopolymer transport system component